MKKQRQRHNGQLLSQEGDFSLWATSPVYKTLCIDDGYIRNTKTGENCGQMVELRKHFYKDGERLSEPIYDEECYEFVFEEVVE